MARKSFPQKALSFLFELLRRPQNQSSPQWKTSNGDHASKLLKYQKYSTSLVHRAEELANQTVVFESEGALLKSSSLFPYFMLVALEAGGPFRALVFFLLYPFVCLFGEELGLKIMVFLCFFGIRKEGFRIGIAVLPKFFLEDVGREGFEVVMSCGRKVGVSNLPTVMVEGFLKDYLGVDDVVGRELKVVCGYFVGIMEAKKSDGTLLNQILGEEKTCSGAIGIVSHRTVLDHHVFASCKEVYLVSEAEKRDWHILPRGKQPKSLIFHDGRLAFRPTQLAILAMIMWIPFGFVLFLIRFTAGRLLAHCMSSPIMAFTGTRTTVLMPKSPPTSTKNENRSNGAVYVCNHRTLLDPLYVELATNKSLSTVTYSLSKFHVAISPIKAIQLTRDREKDRVAMEKLLSQGDLVVCSEGTTCREPYLLRFSPLFAELTDNIIPVAIDVQVTMFYGTTASGFKCLDSAFHFMNPYPTYTLTILDKLPSSQTLKGGGVSKFEVANNVQHKIAEALGFKCTDLTRKDKYMILAGNEGMVQDRKRR
ncbi:putative glycerol-3-phosphate acyltransferase 3 [Morella rubra]|uniref:Putative glycerol-3-phosphate acyltransferase 3 n=1 Tax=Morella rubra TaxID=262757 RepID=A0A6A1UYL1_9ROSI|nr:putative glycerol-3-phosphate acyltransferase 3 [Morella rubra]